jgi:hypothetical protein
VQQGQHVASVGQLGGGQPDVCLRPSEFAKELVNEQQFHRLGDSNAWIGLPHVCELVPAPALRKLIGIQFCALVTRRH